MFDSICSQKPNRAEYKVNKTTKTSSSPIIWTLHGQYFHDTKKIWQKGTETQIMGLI